jgi:phosphate starvation-inducible protein PhoH
MGRAIERGLFCVKRKENSTTDMRTKFKGRKRMQSAQSISKKTRRELRKEKITLATMQLKDIQPLTENQERAFAAWYNDKDLFLHGSAGTGKTLMAFYFALREVMLENADKVLIIRSVVPSREMGFLPGSEKEKTKSFELPYYGICQQLYGRGDAYEILKQKEIIEFSSTSFLRGLTFDNTIIIIDECQNLSWMELHTVMSRIGNYSRVIFSGDTAQSDLDERRGKYDLCRMIEICKAMNCFQFINMTPEDVVRSGKARDYILAVEKLGYH